MMLSMCIAVEGFQTNDQSADLDKKLLCRFFWSRHFPCQHFLAGNSRPLCVMHFKNGHLRSRDGTEIRYDIEKALNLVLPAIYCPTTLHAVVENIVTRERA